MTMRLRDFPVVLLAGALATATVWMVLIDFEAVSPHHQWIPRQIVFLCVLLIPLAAAWQLASGKPTALFVLLAPVEAVVVVLGVTGRKLWDRWHRAAVA